MPETDKVFAGSIPENYDRYLVPLIFESFAQDILRERGPLLSGGGSLLMALFGLGVRVLRCPLVRVKQTCPRNAGKSESDPNRTLRFRHPED
jgi:hypothetical protein